MNAIAPNLTVLVGELVGARLIAHAGSLLNLAKHPASTVQILGAEKALFRALKTKHETPKYGLIYHASLVGSSAPKFKGKISRVLASKCSLAIRYDALGDGDDASVGIEGREKVEMRLRQLEGGALHDVGSVSAATKIQKYTPGENGVPASYNTAADSTLPASEDKKAKKEKKEKKEKKDKKRKIEDTAPAADDEEAAKAAKKAAKKEKKRKAEEAAAGSDASEEPKKKKKKKKKKEKE
eukprot:SAG31_NODE_2599_length_5415_cov_21.828254_2_plen_239_part_00